MKQELTLQAPAKINRSLKVLNKRNDGFYNLESLMHMVGLFDQLTFQIEKKGIQLKISNSSLPSNASNLVYQAAALLQKKMEETGHPPKGVTITLKKEIPVAAGLAGGSSNAAATLVGLNTLWELSWPRKKLAALGATLGSDIPFFFEGPSAWISGRGEIVDSLSKTCEGWVVLVHPEIFVSTASVFKAYSQEIRLTKPGAALNITTEEARPSPENLLEHPFNDLEKVTLKQFPELNRVKNVLLELGGKGVLMSGSGPTIFAIFKHKKEAEETVKQVRQKIQTVSFKAWAVPLLQKSPFEHILF